MPELARTWTNSTGNLPALTPGSLRSLAYSIRNPAGAVVVGSAAAMYTTSGATFSTWSLLGSDLQTGKELWNRQVRDTADHGPFPP